MNVTLPKISEDEAYNFILSVIPKGAKDGTKVDLPEIISKYLDRHKPANTTGGMVSYQLDHKTNSEPFFCAAWRLCVRGVLAQLPTYVSHQHSNYTEAGTEFVLTEYGAEWIRNLPEYNSSSTEYGRFSQLLSRHERRLGKGFQARSQEALRSYRAQTYLACCVMCGAAAESITLALAVAKKGNEEEALREYGSSGGRGKIERFLLANQDSHISRNLPNYTSLLNDWRDVAAHSDALVVGEEEAFTALLLLLRYAKFAEERWNDIVSNSV